MGLISRVSSRTYMPELKMNNKNLDLSDDDDQHNSDSSNQNDSDAELMAAFRSGAIQPGSVIQSEELKKSREVVNNPELLEQFIAQTSELINKNGEDFMADFAEFPVVMIKDDQDRANSAEEHAQ